MLQQQPDIQELNRTVLISTLADHENSLDWMTKRVKQDMTAVKEATTFMKRRAAIEEEYAKSMLKLSRDMKDHISDGSCSLGTAWTSVLDVTSGVGESRMALAQSINAVSEELNTVFKDAERSRKHLKEAGSKQQKLLSDQDHQVERTKHKLEQLVDELQQMRIQQSLTQRNSYFDDQPQQLQQKRFSLNNIFHKKRTPDELEVKIDQVNHEFQMNKEEFERLRQVFYARELPNLLQQLKEVTDECDVALQALLMKYAKLYEDALLADATQLSPINAEGVSLREALGRIDFQRDFEQDLNKFVSATPRVQLPSIDDVQHPVAPPRAAKKRVFGLPLDLVLQREDSECPLILQKCFEVISQDGLDYPSLYRTPIPSEKLDNIKAIVDADPSSVMSMSDDVPLIAGIVKMYLTELPEPLLTKSLFGAFVKAARIEQPKRRLITIHEVVNQLPDASYIVLKHLMRHLKDVLRHSKSNHMDVAYLGMVFGPILLTGVDLSGDAHADVDALRDVEFQCIAVETILSGFGSIFDA